MPRSYIVFDIIAPVDAPQVYRPPLNGVAHPLAPEVMQAMRQHGRNPVGLWKVINGLGNDRQPQGRAQRRCLCLRFWGAVRELLRFRVLYRHGPLIALQDFATRPKPRSPRRLPPSVVGSTCKLTGSNPVVVPAAAVRNDPQPTARELVSSDANTVGSFLEGKSAPPTATEITAAARQLALQPRKVKRPWTGFLSGERVKRGWLVQVPTGEVLPVYVALRGRVLVALPDEPHYASRAYDRYDADQVRRVKLPEAALLGRQPPRPGRRRGRPQKTPMYE